MASYLAEVKDDVKGILDEAFEALWKDVIEPALKQSYKNGLADGKKGDAGQEEDSGGSGRRPGNRFRRKRAGSRT